MNDESYIILCHPRLNRHILYSIHFGPDFFLLRLRVIGNDGELLIVHDWENYDGLVHAKTAMKTMAEAKLKNGWQEVEAFPSYVTAHLDATFTDSDKARMLEAAHHERYVVFCDTTGLERQFDTNLEYLAFDRGYKDTLEVIDR